MIVLLGGGAPENPQTSWLPGPFDAPENDGFRKAYEVMAKHANLTLAQAVEIQYNSVCKKQKEVTALNGAVDDSCEQEDKPVESLQRELEAFGKGPPDDLAQGTPERVEWFSEWLKTHDVQQDPDPATMTRAEMLKCLDGRMDLINMASAQGILNTRRVKVAPLKKLKKAVDTNTTLKWSKAYHQLCGHMGIVLVDDESDGTSRVSFPYLRIGAWFPTSALIDGDIDVRKVVVAPVEELRLAVEAHPALKWSDKLGEVAGGHGDVVTDDPSDQTSHVRFAAPFHITAWLPTSTLKNLDGGNGTTAEDVDEEEEEEL